MSQRLMARFVDILISIRLVGFIVLTRGGCTRGCTPSLSLPAFRIPWGQGFRGLIFLKSIENGLIAL